MTVGVPKPGFSERRASDFEKPGYRKSPASAVCRTHILKVISGGQTGVDRAALDAALAAGIPIGGWCPRGRRAEDGTIPAIYPLRETPSRDYRERTRWNVRDSEGTLILTRAEFRGGTALTWRQSRRLHRPVFVGDLRDEISDLVRQIDHWAAVHHVRILNVAGPRASQQPLAHELVKALLAAWWSGGTFVKDVSQAPQTSCEMSVGASGFP